MLDRLRENYAKKSGKIKTVFKCLIKGHECAFNF